MNKVCSGTFQYQITEKTGFPQGGKKCPICGKLISEEFLPDARGFIDERLYQCGDVRIISPTTLECDFYHFYDEDADMTIRDFHLLTAVVETHFDRTGKCITFDVVEIHPAGH